VSVALLTLVLAVAAVAVPVSAQAVTQSYHLNIPRQQLDGALKDLAQQTGLQIARFSDTPGGSALVGPVSGEMTVGEALTSLLVKSGLTYKMVNDRTIAVVAPGPEPGASAQSSAADQASPATSDDGKAKEGKKTSSVGFRVAQVDQGQTSSPSSVEKQDAQASKKKPLQLEEVVVTGSRLPQTSTQEPQPTQVYTAEQIAQSGRQSVADFLNTLPQVSVASTESGYQTADGATTVRLHGLPVGTTLVLINGRRAEVNGVAAAVGDHNVLNLGNIPLGAVDRIEVVPSGSSAIYGSDAIAGVINIIFKSHFDGLEFNAGGGAASATKDWHGDLAWGKTWSAGSLTLIATFQDQSELSGTERPLTANADHRPLGGADGRSALSCNPGNVFTLDGSPLPGGPSGNASSFAAVLPAATGNPAQTGFQGNYGQRNTCSRTSTTSIIPEEHQASLLVTGNYQLTPGLELFTDLLFSRTRQLTNSFAPGLLGQPGFAQFTVSASNPYNPFGETVGVGVALAGLGLQGQDIVTNYFRPVVGIRGNIFGSNDWKWEVAGWMSEDRDRLATTNNVNGAAAQAALNSTSPATALNPFVAGPAGPAPLLQSLVSEQTQDYRGKSIATNGFVRGPLGSLPSGPLEVVVGGEFERQELFSSANTFTNANFHRNSYAMFAEMRIPIFGDTRSTSGNTLAATLADRYDHYADFGGRSSPQFGLEYRPVESLLLRGTYGKSFKAPSLLDLFRAELQFPNIVLDPMRGNQQTLITETVAGNPGLQPETGQSHTWGLVYSSAGINGLQLSVTQWQVDESNSIQFFFSQTLVPNETLFPGAVIRGPTGAIVQVNDAPYNFGKLSVQGIDFQIDYRYESRAGEWSPSLAATDTTRYSAALLPGAPVTDRLSMANDDGNWAPRWKGTARLGWKLGAYAASIAGRYVGGYQDYGSTREIGKFWLFDLNLRYGFGQELAHFSPRLSKAYVEFGGLNILDRRPQYSNFDFGFPGYDAAQADIRGRFLYLRAGVKL